MEGLCFNCLDGDIGKARRKTRARKPGTEVTAEMWPWSCHNRDMPKISSKYAFAHLQWHNLKSVHPTIVKVKYTFLERSFIKESKNGFIFVVGASLKHYGWSKIEILIKKKVSQLYLSDFHHAIPHIKFKARFVFFKTRPIYKYSLLGFTPMLDRKAPGRKATTDQK